MLRNATIAVLCLGLVGLAGCGSKQIRREDPNKQLNVKMELGMDEVKEAAEDVKQQLAAYQFPEEDRALYKDGRIRVRVQTIDNRTNEHFDTMKLTDKVTTVMRSSGKIVPVMEVSAMKDVHEERAYQDAMTTEETKAADRQETAPRYVLRGNIKKDVSKNEDMKVFDYNFVLELINVKTGEKLFGSDKDIRKVKD